jgi:threonine/homoserine/homoserine lactone efflux protein
VGVGLVVALSSVTHLLLGLAEATLLLYLGGSSVSDAWRAIAKGAHAPKHVTRRPTSVQQTWWMGAAISLANPYEVAFWLSVGGTTVRQFRPGAPLLLAGFFLARLLWGVVLAWVVGRCAATVIGRLYQWVSLGCGGLLLASGLALGVAVVG